jgi:zinc carboxypeptidase
VIDLDAVLKDLPHFDTFCSVAKLNSLVDELRTDPAFEVRELGTSVDGVPIHHLRFGNGSVKAMVVAFPHCKEPIGGMTAYALMTLLHQRNEALLAADVEWHIVPCIDPDGALLNESWTQQPVSMEAFMKGFYVQVLGRQVDGSFQVKHKNLVWTEISKEADLLRGLLDRIRPDFFYSLHNAWTGGAQYFLNRDIDHVYYDRLYDFLGRQGMPVQRKPIWREFLTPFSEGIVETWTVKKFYDYLERTTPAPEEFLTYGGGSWDYLEEIKPEALTLVTEMGYVRHPMDESDAETGENLRRFRLRLDADSKYLATLMLAEWDKVSGDVDSGSPLHQAIIDGAVIPAKERLGEGGRPLSLQPTRDILFNPQYDRPMTESDAFQACMVDAGFFFLCQSYQFVRLLKASPQTPAVRRAVERLDPAFDEAVAEIDKYVAFDRFEVMDHDTLAAVQLGSGLIVLDSLLEKRA